MVDFSALFAGYSTMSMAASVPQLGAPQATTAEKDGDMTATGACELSANCLPPTAGTRRLSWAARQMTTSVRSQQAWVGAS